MRYGKLPDRWRQGRAVRFGGRGELLRRGGRVQRPDTPEGGGVRHLCGRRLRGRTGQRRQRHDRLHGGQG